MARVLKTNGTGIVFTIVKQFGTGVIIATALIHVRLSILSRGKQFADRI